MIKLSKADDGIYFHSGDSPDPHCEVNFLHLNKDGRVWLNKDPKKYIKIFNIKKWNEK